MFRKHATLNPKPYTLALNPKPSRRCEAKPFQGRDEGCKARMSGIVVYLKVQGTLVDVIVSKDNGKVEGMNGSLSLLGGVSLFKTRLRTYLQYQTALKP